MDKRRTSASRTDPVNAGEPPGPRAPAQMTFDSADPPAVPTTLVEPIWRLEVLTVQVLIAHVSPSGSTRDIGERIAARLRDRGHRVDCRPTYEIQSLRGYDAVIVGSAIHNQAWLPEAADFLATHADELLAGSVWLFSVGLPGALARPLRKLAMREGPRAVAPFMALVQPHDTHLFSGVVRREQFPRMGRMLHLLAGGTFGDFRDWPEIDAWAEGISDCLLDRQGSSLDLPCLHPAERS